MLFEPQKQGNANDPFMINPKGAKIQVPESRVRDLLKQGYMLVDKTWKPTPTDDLVTRKEPLPLEKLHEEVSKEQDLLSVTEI